MLINYNDVLTIDEVCEVLRLGKNTVYGLIKDGTLPSMKLGKKYLITKDSLIKFLLSFS
ncbi:MAG: helix-turn-helix domain-containing protein [Lachnospiraceae bacterium]|nr:helix-turn-helix domain-containing protein [Lachnospiraceae bacterium]